MPMYGYKCVVCGKTTLHRFRMDNARPAIMDCAYCYASAERVFSMPMLVTNPHHLRPENKWAELGYGASNYHGVCSDSDLTKQRHADDKRYIENHTRKVDVGLAQERNPYEE